MITNISHIIEALEQEEGGFSTLKNVEVVRNFCIAGGESVIGKASINGVLFALKCYTTEKPNRKKRYEMLNEVSRNEGVVPAMRYLEKELTVIDNYGVQRAVDVLLYRWVEGVTLLEAIERCVEFYDRAQLVMLCRNFTLLASKLSALSVTHGDLKPQNIIVGSDGEMSIIDYDMAFSDKMPCDEIVRTQWYQHPLAESWNEQYAIAVIAVSLFLLSLDPLLFHIYHNGENILIDTRKATRSGVQNKKIRAMLAPYPNYGALFDLVASPTPLCKEIPLFASYAEIIDKQGVLRRVVNEDGLYGFIDQTENLIVACCYGDATPFNDGVAGVRLNGTWYIFDVTGCVAVDEVFDEVGVSQCGRIPVSKNRVWYYLNAFTFEPLGTAIYDYAYPFSGGFGLVRVRNDFYFLDEKGEKPFGAKTFRFARPFVNGYAVVADEKGYFVIDTYGRRVSQVFPDQILSYDGRSICYRDKENVVRSVVCEM